jgi:hypothetical protein
MRVCQLYKCRGFAKSSFINQLCSSKMSKRPRDSSIEKKQKELVLQLAERGDFAAIAKLLEILELTDDVLCELIRICNVRIKEMCAEFALAQATFITDRVGLHSRHEFHKGGNMAKKAKQDN